MRMAATTAFAAILLAGCAAEIPQSTANVAAAGSQLTEQRAAELVQQYIHETFKDPYSVMDLQIERPALCSYPALGKQAEWEVNFSCNAKNSFGAYTGRQSHAIFVLNDVIDKGHTDAAEGIRRQLESL
jgi:hypothetical protein